MFTIHDDLRIARDRYVSALRVGECDVADQWRATSMRLAYNAGELPPNYPVPVPIMVYEMDPEWYWLMAERRRLRSALIVEKLKP